MNNRILCTASPLIPSIALETRLGTTDEIVIQEIWSENVYRISESDCKGTVIDIGANIGAFSTYAASLGAQVIAIEPEPENYSMLLLNCNQPGIRDCITCMQAAIYGSRGVVKVKSASGGSQVSLLEGPSEAPAFLLEDIFNLHAVRECSILKMDVEGCEYLIFGATPEDAINRIKYLTMEFHGTDSMTFGALVAKLTKTHAVQTLGSYERGGYIYARRY